MVVNFAFELSGFLFQSPGGGKAAGGAIEQPLVPQAVLTAIEQLPSNAHPMDVMRTGVPNLSSQL